MTKAQGYHSQSLARLWEQTHAKYTLWYVHRKSFLLLVFFYQEMNQSYKTQYIA